MGPAALKVSSRKRADSCADQLQGSPRRGRGFRRKANRKEELTSYKTSLSSVNAWESVIVRN